MSDTAKNSVKSAATTTPYITTPVRCPMSATAQKNIGRVQIISIDSYPNLKIKFYNQVKTSVQVPVGSTIENRACNPHVNYVIASLLGVNNNNIPAYKGMKVTFIPAISCAGTAWDPDIVLALNDALTLAQSNAAAGINTIVSYPIGGSYNSKAKVDAMRALANTPRTYFLMSSGNNNQNDYCVLPTESIPSVYVIGASKAGSQLSEYGNIGSCVRFYTPGRYKSVVNNKQIWGTSYSMPIAGNIFINNLLAYPDLSKDEIFAKVNALSKTVSAKTSAGNYIDIKVFPKATVCSTKATTITGAEEITATPSAKPLLTKFNQINETTPTDVDEGLLHNPISVPIKSVVNKL